MISRIITVILALVLTSGSLFAQDTHKTRGTSALTVAGAKRSVSGARVSCASGFAAEYPCQLADLMALVDIDGLTGGLDTLSNETNDLWGWTDEETGKEYAIVGMNGGTSFVDISDPENPVTLGFLKTHTPARVWRDIKVYKDHAFIVADAAGAHGMQVFDLTQLRSVSSPPQLFSETAHYDGINSAHNIAINEDSGFAYLVGGSGGGETCGGGLHIVNIQNPIAPVMAGCFSTGYTHDAQCVIYDGPDTEHRGKEICIESSVKDVVITDVTDKSNPSIIGTGTYPTASYIHQGWLTGDQRYFFQDDELDERDQGTNTTTIIWDFLDLDDPVVLTTYVAATSVYDHNLYIREHLLFQSNYTAGLRILDISDVANPVEVSYFDTFPANDGPGFGGSWSNYPFFKSNIIAVTSDSGGLFLITSGNVTLSSEQPELPAQLTLSAPYPNPFDDFTALSITANKAQRTEVVAYDMLGRQVAVLFEGLISPDTPQVVTFDAKNFPNGKYIIRATGELSSLSRVVTLIR